MKRVAKEVSSKQSSGKKQNPLEQSKNLNNKLNHLMKDTKSSAARNANAGARMNTVDDNQLGSNPNKLTPNKSRKNSPSKPKRESPEKSGMVKAENFDNFKLDTRFNLDDETEYTLEGIAGMVRITPGKEPEIVETSPDNMFYSLPVQQNSPLVQTEEDEFMGSPTKVKQTIEVESESISINVLDLNEICKTPNIFEIENSTRGSEVKEKKKGLFDSEILAIIGNINSRAQELRSKFNI